MLRHLSRQSKLRCVTWFLALLVLGLAAAPSSHAMNDPDLKVFQLPDQSGGVETEGGDPDGVGLDNVPPSEDPPFAPDPDGTLDLLRESLDQWFEVLSIVFRTTI